MSVETPFTIGLDLGQSNDYTAIAVLETQLWFPSEQLNDYPFAGITPGWNSPAGIGTHALEFGLTKNAWPSKPPVHLRHLERMRGIPYPQIVQHVKQMISREPFTTCGYALIVDATGVGAAVVDLFRQEDIAVQACTIHGGDAVSRVRGGYRVPKRELVAATQAVMQTGRLQVAEGLELWPVLKDELRNFKVKINPETAHDSYSHWRESKHDDLVLALAMAAWFRDYFWAMWDTNRIRRNEDAPRPERFRRPQRARVW